MKLTKEVVEVLKYHGYMTFTESTETFLKHFETVEDLGDKGFITDRGAIDFLKTVFDENGVNRSVEVGEEELEKQATEESEVLEVPAEEPVVESEPEVLEVPEAPVETVDSEPENAPEFDGAGFTEADNEPISAAPAEEPVVESEPEVLEVPAEEPVVESEPEVLEVPEAPVEDVKPKKTTSTKKTTTKKTTTKKES